MLRIRLRRIGRKNEPHFQVVVAPHTNSVKGNVTQRLGWYNPKTKELKVDKDLVISWVNKGAKPSNTMAKLLISQGIKHKNIVFVKDAPGKPRTKESDTKKKTPAAPAEPEKAPDITDEKVGTGEKDNSKEPSKESGNDKSVNNAKVDKSTDSDIKKLNNQQKENNQEEAK